MLNTIAYGLTIGGILYIISIGLSLTFGTMRIVNFAHGFIYTIGAYLLITTLPILRENFILAALATVLAVIPISYVIERFIIRKLYGVSIDYAIIATYAVVLIGVDLIKWIWGASPIPLSDPIGIDVTIFSVTIPLYRLIIIILSFVIFIALTIFFRKTMVGKIVVAALEDKDAVRSLGINVDKYFAYVFIIGSCLAALGGVLYAPITSVHPYMGMTVLLISFAVVLVGGLGNIKGTFVSAFVLGLIMAITGRFWGPAAETMVFIVMGIILIFKPIEA
ncbi:MAG: branched-chain amino acid ABC transporter permease [Syntrophorhabdaceae bacterium]|nr:branched-chain amino acid ABC transporter permease [Syntrophorhabdales bacterium]MBP9560745.1 branched-chain amino acid ABC transporter permease [Syntrophorhabdaceae bacterium]